MTTATPDAPTAIRTLAEVVHALGDVPLSRIRLPIGGATVADLEKNPGCELIDGTLVELTVGATESILAFYLGRLLDDFVRPRNLGLLLGEQGLLEVLNGQVRAADVAFLSWDQLPGRRRPTDAVPVVSPDLAVEVLSPSNTRREMERKRREFFAGGSRLVWMVDPAARTVAVYTSETEFRTLVVSDTLDGGDVLPGFTLPLAVLFAELDRHG